MATSKKGRLAIAGELEAELRDKMAGDDAYFEKLFDKAGAPELSAADRNKQEVAMGRSVRDLAENAVWAADEIGKGEADDEKNGPLSIASVLQFTYGRAMHQGNLRHSVSEETWEQQIAASSGVFAKLKALGFSRPVIEVDAMRSDPQIGNTYMSSSHESGVRIDTYARSYSGDREVTSGYHIRREKGLDARKAEAARKIVSLSGGGHTQQDAKDIYNLFDEYINYSISLKSGQHLADIEQLIRKFADYSARNIERDCKRDVDLFVRNAGITAETGSSISTKTLSDTSRRVAPKFRGYKEALSNLIYKEAQSKETQNRIMETVRGD
jgi:hypothetical protein